MTARLVVLASGSGTNLQAVLDACRSRTLDAKVVSVISDRAESGALERAQAAGVTAVHCGVTPEEAREAYDERLARLVRRAGPDLVILAGWMRLLSNTFLQRFPEQVVNLHPALPGEYPGTRAIERAFADFTTGHGPAAAGRTGVIVHRVPDEGVDDGPVLATAEVPIRPDDTLATLSERIHAVEHELLVSTLRTLTSGGGASLRPTGG